jgi:ribosomal protein S18 acetylase RimI-like enzyme
MSYSRSMHAVRLLTEADAKEFWKFRLTGLEESPQAFTESAAELRSSSVELTAQRLSVSSEHNFVLGAFVESRLVGTAGFVRSHGERTAHKGRIWGVYVHPAHRRAGIANALIESLLARVLRLEGCRQVSLAVSTTQVAAIALYDSFGFKSIGVEPCSLRIGDDFIDEQHRVLMLDSLRKA